MPELPEVETICRLLRRVIVGHRISEAEVFPDPIVFKGVSAANLREVLLGSVVESVGRKGKTFWLSLKDGPALMGHLGMSGWVEQYSTDPPRFAKLLLKMSDGNSVAFTDARRLGRYWIADDPASDPTIRSLGPDALDSLPSAKALFQRMQKLKAPIKALLLNQSFVSGIGNYLGDEILYQAHIAPGRSACELTEAEVRKLRAKTLLILKTAVAADADKDRFPENWLFHHRWGGKRGAEFIGKHKIVRETIGGRTTAWVPDLQKVGLALKR